MSAEYPSGPSNGQHVMGKDQPQPEGTKGFSLYHLALRIKDPVKSLKFYREILGMRVIFSMNCGSFSIYYIGCGDEEPVGDAMKNMFNRRGMIELLHQHGTEKDDDFQYIAEASHPRHGFSHLGFCMSNLPEVTKRLQAAGVEIIKPQGVADAQAIGFPSDIEKPRQEWVDLFKNMIMIKDPDGYWIEIGRLVLSCFKLAAQSA